MPSWLGLSAVNPMLLWGGLLIAAPILIHLLSKRKFKIVDWAAMDFLFDADKRNRRRVRLENLLLLLLRCAAVLLISLLVARPYASGGLSSMGIGSRQVERIVLLDDSPSTQVHAGRQTSLDDAKDRLVQFIRDMASQRSGDTLTLLVTSDPETPVVNGQYLSGDEAEEIADVVTNLKPADVSANLDAALLAVEDLLDSGGGGNINRAVYVLSDMRRRDWLPGRETPQDKNVPEILRRVASKAQNTFLVDIGSDVEQNLAVAAVRPRDKTIVQGVESTFEVEVFNAGEAAVDDVEVEFIAGESIPLKATIDTIPGGEAGTAVFTYVFRDTGDIAVRAVLSGADLLPVDNTRHFAARVREGVQVLLVDGDPSSEPERSETFFLQRALAPPGEAISGNAVTVVTENQFEALPLSKFQVIYLCNFYRLSEDRLNALEQYVQDGGGLVIALGDQVEQESFNQQLFQEGKGLSPIGLTGILGDQNETEWVHFNLVSDTHPVLNIFEGSQNPFIKNVPIFRWWGSTLPKESQSSGQVDVIATFTDAEGSPAYVEKLHGNGRVMVITSSLDSDWADWPADPSYLVAVQELNRHMARSLSGEGSLVAGAPIRYRLDPAQYKIEVRVRPPQQEPVTIQAVSEESEADGKDRGLLVRYEDTAQRGLYELSLTGRDEQTRGVLYAVNLDPTEGDLRRVDDGELRRLLGDADVRIDHENQAMSLDLAGSRSELWRPTLLLLGGVLCLEQFLGWLFGRRR